MIILQIQLLPGGWIFSTLSGTLDDWQMHKNSSRMIGIVQKNTIFELCHFWSNISDLIKVTTFDDQINIWF